MADALVLGASTSVCGFKSHLPHHVGASLVSLAPIFYGKCAARLCAGLPAAGLLRIPGLRAMGVRHLWARFLLHLSGPCLACGGLPLRSAMARHKGPGISLFSANLFAKYCPNVDKATG